jgi:alanyl-tRNA synthetase
MTGDELREKYLIFFEQKGHKVIPSSSLIPHGDPTLLLTSAGMVQFKPYFTGEAVPPSPRLASCQKCFRTTDIGSVGNFKHLTFFEMLGNFSIGDYFKKEAIAWAWEFVLDWLKIPKEKLWITIFLDDDESFGYWREIGVSAERIVRCGEKDNFWGPAGETGPCGPCSEIHYDFGEQFSCGPDCSPSCGCGRFLEIWNLVFTEYYQDAQKKRTPLPRKNIDTGMGLERTATVIQGKRSFYDTDLFAPIIQCVSQLTGRKYGENEKTDRAMRIVAEHGRAVAFLITDGVIPSNEGRGYVLRRILRRAALFGRTLGLDKPFLGEVAKEVISKMGHVYPELVKNREPVLKVIGMEETRFDETLSTGLDYLNGALDKMADDAFGFISSLEFRSAVEPLQKAVEQLQGATLGRAIFDAMQQYQKAVEPLQKAVEQLQESELGKTLSHITEQTKELLKIPGKEVFRLYDTYGFPSELTTEIAADNGLSVDLEGFEAEMEQQRERARAAHKFVLGEKVTAVDYSSMGLPATEFVGYKRTSCKAKVLSLAVDGKPQEAASEGQQVEVVLDSTPLYAEMGGQVADTGEIVGKQGKIAVGDMVWANGEIIVHRGKVVEGAVFLGEKVSAEVDQSRRLDIARNHTAIHLLHAALRQVLGSHVHQAGSLVTPDRFRFDFTCEAPVLKEELGQIQRIVNEGIRRNLPVTKKEMPYTQAVSEGAIALFGEKYGDVVRTVKVGGVRSMVSFEVCGGTHIDRTGDIGFFQIIGEGSIGSGMRRIEAVTGKGAEKLIEERFSTLEKIAHELQVPTADVEGKVTGVLEELSAERKRAVALERQLSKDNAESLVEQATLVKDVRVLAVKVSASNMDALRHTGDVLRDKLGSKNSVIVLATAWKYPNFLAMVSPDLVARGLNASQIVKKVAEATGGSGGGRPEMAQGGGKDKDKVEQALNLVPGLVAEKL